ncbi:TniQ family protein [Bacillus cereus]|uniref:TniQ family protein n=1 Tax=Bacillus cereus TaxID=1396 RepID=UPI00187AB60F|nr:helix-turn-helix domain-containing protein [Bacillus cereus]MBE7096921.1 helix-turn-helix domain-containing protein [Bacillus cereus]
MDNNFYLSLFPVDNRRVSKLYSLHPIGAEISKVESLTSYICRLAKEHNVSVGTLMNKVVFPYIESQYLLRSSQNGGNRFYDGAKSINGYYKNSIMLSKALESLTLRGDLTNLTLIKLKQIVSARGLLKSNLSWCPQCLNEFKFKADVYYPLAWSLQAYSVCLIHETSLVSKCLHCNRELPILHRKSINGYCPFCSKWLGEYFCGGKKGISAKRISVNVNIEELLTLDTSDIKKISCSLARLVQKVSQGNIAEFARLTNIPKVTMWDWIRGEKLPDLNRLLSICFQLNVSIKELLLEVYDLHIKEKPSDSDTLTSMPKKVTRRVINMQLLELELIEYLKLDIPISLTQVSREIGYDRKILYKHFPEECEKIVDRFNEHQNCQVNLRKKELSKQVRQAIYKLQSEGIYPSRRKVEGFLEKPGLLREQSIKLVWKAEVHDQGVNIK